jgi:hypothetical protein
LDAVLAEASKEEGDILQVHQANNGAHYVLFTCEIIIMTNFRVHPLDTIDCTTSQHFKNDHLLRAGGLLRARLSSPHPFTLLRASPHGEIPPCPASRAAAQVVAGRGATETLSKIAATAKDSHLLKVAAVLPIRRSKERDDDAAGAADGRGREATQPLPRLPPKDDASLFDQDFFVGLGVAAAGPSRRTVAGSGPAAQPGKDAVGARVGVGRFGLTGESLAERLHMCAHRDFNGEQLAQR